MEEACLFILILAVPIFFFWKWLLKKYIKNKSGRNLWTGLLTFITAPIVYAGVLYVFFSILFYEPGKDFDRLSWLKSTDTRYRMSDDLLKSKVLIGKDTNQVKQILGNANWKNEATHKWTYDMGMGGGGLGFLSHQLEISYSNNKVYRAEHIEIPD